MREYKKQDQLRRRAGDKSGTDKVIVWGALCHGLYMRALRVELQIRSMIRIAVSPAASLPSGSVGYEPQTNAKGERLVWLESAVVDRLRGHARASGSCRRRFPPGSSSMRRKLRQLARA
jgi:hypothetical protein